ncbi:uncharacterized protein LOC141910586 [Tubulanus polymorphus]|uniref:uncharacterized protein LOC141910586 n=1 Tax=Tubulanus polymorphus TaxID=672921 RepID=UPI003DA4E6E3
MSRRRSSTARRSGDGSSFTWHPVVPMKAPRPVVQSDELSQKQHRQLLSSMEKKETYKRRKRYDLFYFGPTTSAEITDKLNKDEILDIEADMTLNERNFWPRESNVRFEILALPPFSDDDLKNAENYWNTGTLESSTASDANDMLIEQLMESCRKLFSKIPDSIKALHENVIGCDIEPHAWHLHMLRVDLTRFWSTDALIWNYTMTYDRDLVGNLGYFVHRTLMILKHRPLTFKLSPDTIPEIYLRKEDIEMIATVNLMLRSYKKHIREGRPSHAIDDIFSLSRYGNQYLGANRPWISIKATSENERKKAGTVLGLCANICLLLSLLILPFLPRTAADIQEQIGFSWTDDVIPDYIVPYLDSSSKLEIEKVRRLFLPLRFPDEDETEVNVTCE